MSTGSRLPKSIHHPAATSTVTAARGPPLSIMTTNILPLPSHHQRNIRGGDNFASSASESNDPDTPTLAQTIILLHSPPRLEKQTDRHSQTPALKLTGYADADADTDADTDEPEGVVTSTLSQSYVCLPRFDLTTHQYASWRGRNFDGPEWTEEIAKIEEDSNLATIIGICQWVATYFAEDFPASCDDRVSWNRKTLGPNRCKVLRTSMLRTAHRILYFQTTWDEFLGDDEHLEIFLQNCRDLQPAYMLEGIVGPLGSLGIYI